MRHPRTTAIIIPTLNEASITATVDAVLAQSATGPAPEVIVVGRDDAGRIRARDGVRFVETARPVYPGEARNLGAAATDAEHLLFLDSDVVPAQGCIAALCRHLADHDCFASGAVHLRPAPYWPLATNIAMLHEYLDHWPAAPRPYLASLAFGVRHAAFDRTGGFEPTLRSAEDLDLFVRARRLGYELHFEPAARVSHTQAIGSFGALYRKFRTYGAYSGLVRRRHRAELGGDGWLRRPGLLRLGAPAIAAAVTMRVFLRSPALLRFGHTAPVVFVSKLAWCLGAAESPDPEGRSGQS